MGLPFNRPCPECGYVARLRERWVVGELHLEGPAIVAPIFIRFLISSLLMISVVIASFALASKTPRSLGLVAGIDFRWHLIPISIVVPLVVFLLSRPIRSHEAVFFRLDKNAASRKRLAPSQLLWWLFAGLLYGSINSTSSAPLFPLAAPVSMPQVQFVFACLCGIASQVSWLLFLLHLGRMMEYLLEGVMVRTVAWWVWIWCVGVVAIPVVSLVQSRGHIAVDPLEVLWSLIRFSMIGVYLGTLLICLTTWRMACCLVLSYESIARDTRLSTQERNRYTTPK